MIVKTWEYPQTSLVSHLAIRRRRELPIILGPAPLVSLPGSWANLAR